MSTAFDPALLLAETNWLRRLVRGLVIDEASADDVVQETLLRALERPPRDVDALPSWLRAVARNEALQVGRRAGSRSRRERAVARPEATLETPDAVVAKAEAQAELGRRVLALEEPYRTTLLLRYVEDLAPEEIAARQGIPGGTVRSRLKRGLDLLREDLDRESGGDRRAWVAAILPLADLQPPTGGGAAGPAGGLLLTTQAKVVAAAVAVLLAAGLWLALRPGGVDPGGQESARAGVDAPEVPALAGRGTRDVAPPAAAPAVVPAPPAEERAARVGLAFVDETGRAIPPEDVRARYAEAGLPARVTWVSAAAIEGGGMAGMLAALLGPRGAWQRDDEIDWSDGHAVVAAPSEGRWRLFVDRPGAAPWLSASVEPAGLVEALEIRLPLAPRTISVRLVAAGTREPLSNAEAVPFHEQGDDTAFLAGVPRRAGAGGELRLPVEDASEDPKGRGTTWWIRTPTHAGSIDRWQLSRWAESAQGEVALQPTAVVEGDAFTSEGASAAGLEVVWMRKGLVLRTRVDSGGRFRLSGIPLRGDDSRFPSGTDGESVRIGLVEDLAGGKFTAASVKLRPGEVTSNVRIGKPASTDDAAFAGRITVGGRPLPGIFVGLRGASRDGRMLTTDADGAFRAAGMTPGPFSVQVYFGDPRVIDDFHAEFRDPLVLEPGRERRMDLDLPDGAVRLRVLDAESGKPVVGAVGWGRPAQKDLEASRFEGMRYSAGWGGRVADDGTILLRGLVPGHPHVVSAGAEGYEEAEQADVLPGTGEAPAEATLRIRRKPVVK